MNVANPSHLSTSQHGFQPRFHGDEKEPTVLLIYVTKLEMHFFFVILIFNAQCKSCRCHFISALPDLVTMMYSRNTYKLFLSRHYLLLTFNKILKHFPPAACFNCHVVALGNWIVGLIFSKSLSLR